jgi:archaetidylinositol phosphate synthase
MTYENYYVSTVHNSSFVSAVETDVAKRICRRLPMPLNANFAWLATFGIVLNWFGDSLDGNLARFRKIERPKFGFFIDHTVDALSTFVVMIGLSLSGMIHPIVGLAVLAAHNLMVCYVYINHSVSRVLVISHSRVGPTEIRILLILANTIFVGAAVLFTGYVPTIWLVLNVLFALWGLASFATFVAKMTQTASQLRAELR